MFEGMALFLSYLFANFPYRKVYAEVPESNMSLFWNDFAQVEGTLKEYLFHNGHFADMHLVSILREQWITLQGQTGW